MSNKLSEVKAGANVRCKSYQTRGTFEGTVKDVNESVSGSPCFLVEVSTVNGAKMAHPFERWTSAEEIEDWDN